MLDLIELGVDALRSCKNMNVVKHFNVVPRQPDLDPADNPYFLNNTKFEINFEKQSLDYGTAMGMEMKLMQDLLAAGLAACNQQSAYAQDQEAYAQESQRIQNQQAMAENMRMMDLQREEVRRGSSGRTLGRSKESPQQSPKGTIAGISSKMSDLDLTPTAESSKLKIDPTCKPFEPRRRSDPQQPVTFLGDGLTYSPIRHRGSSSVSLPATDYSSDTRSPLAGAAYTTPTRTKGNGRFSLDHTIEEENDEELFMAINHANLHRTC